MKFFLLMLSFSLSFFSESSKLFANEIPGYIGQQSFRLTDDSQFGDLVRRSEEAKIELARVDQARNQLSILVRDLSVQRERIVSHMNDLQNKIDESNRLKKALQDKLSELSKNPEANSQQISETKSQIENLDRSILDLSRQYGASKLDMAPINVRLDRAQADLGNATRNTQIAMERMQTISRDRENYRQDLIRSIQYVNNQGARTGAGDGSSDGSTLARRLGQDIGTRDGSADGFSSGTTDGQNRDYNLGNLQGESDGSARGKLDGQRDGTLEGTKNGNISAGNREGTVAGIKRAELSDAATVGINQGKKAGLDRAIRTGSAKGNTIGEDESVSKFESGQLNTQTLDGPFVGSFSKRSPNYPGDFNGPNFNPNIYNSRDILRRAYADGYIDQYREYTRYEYLRRIDNEYNQVYDGAYTSNYNQANSRQYPEYYEQGRKDGDARAYSRDYSTAKSVAYKIAFDQFDTNPTRTSDAFKGSYKNSELQAYNEKYEEIRKENFDRLETETFKGNIAAQIEIYRQKRINEVTKIYNNNAVLSFVSSEMLDGGITGIAKLDGVFQPGETTIHSVTLQNFGFKSADNVSVQMDNGALVKLPSIPARSIVVVKGAGLSLISKNAQIGSTAKTSLKVVSKLTSDDVVEAAHFDSIENGVLKNADLKNVKVSYPLSLSNLALDQQLLKDVANKLKIVVNNNSKRAYKGEMKVQVLVNSQSQILTKEFGVLSSLETSAQLSDAEILVNNESDIYRDLDFSASISQNGVTLGVLGTNLSAMAKGQYIDKKNAPVIIANSDKNLKQFLDAINLAGGVEKVSLLDLSLSSFNAQVMANGLNQKVLLIIDDEKATNLNSLNNFIGKSKSSSFVFIDEYNAGLKNALNLAISKDVQKLLWDKKVIMFTNPHRAAGVEKSSAMFQSTLSGFDKDLELAANLTMSATDLIAKFKSTVNRNTFFTPNDAIKTYSLKAMSEILCINKAYDESGKIFSRDKKWAEMVSNDGSLFINALKAASSGEVNEEKLSTILPAIALKDTISNAMSNDNEIFKAMMSKISKATNNVLNDMDDSFKKNLKKFDKGLYNNAYDKASIHRPFYISPPQDSPI